MDYGKRAKQIFLLGLVSIVVGAVGELAINGLSTHLTQWDEVVLTDMIGVGILLMIVGALGFGLILPLVLE